MEAQAIGRAHRMGQEETVEVYRLVTRGTIEEKNSGTPRTKETSGVTSIGRHRVTWQSDPSRN